MELVYVLLNASNLIFTDASGLPMWKTLLLHSLHIASLLNLIYQVFSSE
jgi:hypothetical protein